MLAQIDRLPLEFMGSALRGSFGVSLKKISCINPSYICHQCFAQNNCLYYDFFEVKNKFHSYRFSKALVDQNFDFTLYLFENSCEKLPYILCALKEMLTIQGIGIERTLFHITGIMCNGVNVLEKNMFNISAVLPKEFNCTFNDNTKSIVLIFKTPLRMKSENKLLYSKPSLEQVITSIYHRMQGLKSLPLGELPYTPKYQEIKSMTFFHDITRYSNRQQTKMQMGGLLGSISYKNIDQQSYQLLKLGEILGAGKQTVFGLGEIKIE